MKNLHKLIDIFLNPVEYEIQLLAAGGFSQYVWLPILKIERSRFTSIHGALLFKVIWNFEGREAFAVFTRHNLTGRDVRKIK